MQKAVDGAEKQIRLVDKGHVAAFWQNDQPRAGNFVVHLA